MQILRILQLSLKLFPLIVLSSAQNCDRARQARVQEGNLGQSAHFNWLGVLIVHLREWDKGRTAMTGIVLVKVKYALANADDVIRIPQSIFQKNTRAVFLPARNTPWFVKLSTYLTHPVYQHSANSIAIIELNLDKVDHFPLVPICLPTARSSYDSTYLYLTGIVDDNKVLEKVVYKMQYLDKQLCEEYLNNMNARSSQELSTPSYLCGDAPNMAAQCLWDNGMALVSNATGYFNLVGLAVQGAGCAAPAPFTNLLPYLSWIHSATKPGEEYSGGSRRQLYSNTPIHELSYVTKHDYQPYPFDVDSLKFYVVEPTDEDTLLITPLYEKWERYDDACVLPKDRMYREYFELRALENLRGTVTYKLSLYDLHHKKCACVRLSIKSEGKSSAILSFKEQIINYKENTELREQSGETPEELFRYSPVKDKLKKKDKTDHWKPDEDFFQPVFINDEHNFYSKKKLINCELFIKFQYQKRAIVEFELFAESEELNVMPVWRPTTPTTLLST